MWRGFGTKPVRDRVVKGRRSEETERSGGVPERALEGPERRRRQNPPGPRPHSGEGGTEAFCRLSPLRAGRNEERSDRGFCPAILALTYMGVSDPAPLIDEVLGRPVPVAVVAPGREVVVEPDGKGKAL